ncbi:MAG: hypothetical protein ACQEXJ_03830 [Myxococcota bacterium]
MSDATLDALERRADALQGRYRFRFADKPRATRDLAEMDVLLKEVDLLLGEVSEAGEGAADLKQRVEEQAETYRREREAIVQAQDAGSAFVEAALLGTRANFVIARYHRNFAGQDRRTRDLGLLDELSGWMEGIQRRMARLVAQQEIAELRRDLEVVTENLDVYRRERPNIENAQDVDDPAQQASLLAALANGQFQLYQVHFAGRSRMTRRPGLLERIIGELSRIRAEMEGVAAAGYSDPTNHKNIGIVGERLGLYREEMDAIRTQQAQATGTSRLDALGREANEVLDEYNRDFAGQDRTTRDVDQLSLLCDRMGEVEVQVNDLVERLDLDVNQGPAGLVRDALTMFEREYRQVREAKLH